MKIKTANGKILILAGAKYYYMIITWNGKSIDTKTGKEFIWPPPPVFRTYNDLSGKEKVEMDEYLDGWTRGEHNGIECN